MTSAVAAATLVMLAVVAWPVRERAREVDRALRPVPAGAEASPGAGQGAGAAQREGRLVTLRHLWHADPVQLFRQWRAARRDGSMAEVVLSLLDGIGPALEAGLPPALAVRLAGRSLGDGLGSTAAGVLASLTVAAEDGRPLAPAWRACAEHSRAPEIHVVAAAWQLSEVTGAPLAEAVRRAVASLREGRERTRRVMVAVAGPRATVVVLTALPLTGPLFGMACGVSPTELYVTNPVGGLSALVGLGLIWVGRAWCGRLVDSVTGTEGPA